MSARLRPPASAVAITGFMGTGKSVVGRMVARKLGMAWRDTDDIVERRAGCSISEIFAREGEERFRDLETAALREALVLCYLEGKTHREAGRILRCPAGTIAWRLKEGLRRLRRRLAARGLQAAVPSLAEKLVQHRQPGRRLTG